MAAGGQGGRGRGDREAAETRARSLAPRLASEGLGSASAQDWRWARSPLLRAAGLRVFVSWKSKLPTQPKPPRQVCENGAMAIYQSPVHSNGPGWGAGNGEEGRKATTVPARKGGAAAAGTRGFTSSLGLGWDVALRAAAAVPPPPPPPLWEEILLAQSNVAKVLLSSCHGRQLCRRQSLLAGAS